MSSGAEHECVDQLISLPPPRFSRLAQGDHRRFAIALFSLSRFNEVVAGPLVPHRTNARVAQQDKASMSALIAELLDDLNGFLYRHIRLLAV